MTLLLVRLWLEQFPYAGGSLENATGLDLLPAMGFLSDMKLWFSPPKIVDPVFGTLVFMEIKKHPERSYWEGEWAMPGAFNPVGISLNGGRDGPSRESRDFYLSLPDEIEQILERCRPPLGKVFRDWLNRELPKNLFSELKLTGFDVDDPKENPPHWRVLFETTGEEWLGIAIPFIGEIVGDAEVDT